MNDQPNLLIVDDSELNLLLLESIMKKVNVNLIKATSGFEALEKAQGLEIALAIIDVLMPGMNGFELAVQLNKSRANDKIPVIFLTANYDKEMHVAQGYHSGAVDYLIKPVNNQILISKINIFLDLFNHKQSLIRHAALLAESSEELKKVNLALQKSEQKYRSYIDNGPDGVFVTDEKGKIIEMNRAASTITGYSSHELSTMCFSDLIQEKPYTDGLNYFSELVKNGTAKADLLYRHKNKTKRWWSVDGVKLTDEQFLCFSKDITDRKKAEKRLQSSLRQLHDLTRHINKVTENERLSIARELHDDLGQALTAVKIDIGIIKQCVSEPPVIEKINKVSELVRETILTVQRLTAKLRPTIIDDLGLEAAMEWYTREFAQRNGVKVSLQIDPGINFHPDASLSIFRIMQESLTNISRYAQANRIEICLHKTRGSINLTIADNGIGISETQINSKKSFGLIGMKERASSLGGSFEVYRGQENGTIIQINLPLNNK